MGYLGAVSTKCPYGSDTVKLGNSSFRAYPKNFGNSCTFSKICFNILHYNGIVRLITWEAEFIFEEMTSDNTLHFSFMIIVALLLLCNSKKNLVIDEQDKKIKPKNFK